MKIQVRFAYSSSPNSTNPSASSVITLNTVSKSHSALAAMIKAQHPGWYNIQIREVKEV